MPSALRQPLRLSEIVAALAAEPYGLQVELVGDPGLAIERLASLDTADDSSLAFVAQARYAAQIATTRAACVVVAPALRDAAVARGATIVTPDPYRCYAALSRLWAARLARPAATGVHPSAVVEAGARIDPGASVGALCFVGAGAVIEAGAVVGPHGHVGADAFVGAHTRMAARVTLGDACRIGARGIVHSGVVIGADGFGFAPHGGRWEKIAQLGAVRIGDDVEIGANTCIDRGALDDTVIEEGVKLDNLIQVGHNVRIGAHTAMAGCVGIAGSTRIGRHCTAGGAAMILGHLELADHVHISAASVVSRSILAPGQYSGFFPIDDNGTWEKNAATLRQLHTLRARVRALEKQGQP